MESNGSEVPQGDSNTFESHYYEWDDLPPVENLEGRDSPLAELPQNLTSENWQIQFKALSKIQSLCKHQPNDVEIYLGEISPHVAKCCGSLRSGVAKNAFMTVRAIGLGLPKSLTPQILEDLLPIVIQKSSYEKRFVAEAAWSAASTLAHPPCVCTDILWHITKFTQVKNPTVVSKAGKLLDLALTSLYTSQPEMVDASLITQLLPYVGHLLSSKLPEGKHAARSMASTLQVAWEGLESPGQSLSALAAEVFTDKHICRQFAAVHQQGSC